eukprot:g5434.t1
MGKETAVFETPMATPAERIESRIPDVDSVEKTRAPVVDDALAAFDRRMSSSSAFIGSNEREDWEEAKRCRERVEGELATLREEYVTAVQHLEVSQRTTRLLTKKLRDLDVLRSHHATLRASVQSAHEREARARESSEARERETAEAFARLQAKMRDLEDSRSEQGKFLAAAENTQECASKAREVSESRERESAEAIAALRGEYGSVVNHFNVSQRTTRLLTNEVRELTELRSHEAEVVRASETRARAASEARERRSAEALTNLRGEYEAVLKHFEVSQRTTRLLTSKIRSLHTELADAKVADSKAPDAASF